MILTFPPPFLSLLLHQLLVMTGVSLNGVTSLFMGAGIGGDVALGSGVLIKTGAYVM